jgi:hypothetical protein
MGIGFLQLMQKMEKRFGYKEIPETAQLKLSSITQLVNESWEEWADRVLQLALRAYEGLPEEFMMKQVIFRVCHSCTDKEAGQYAINQHPLTLDQTLDHLKSFQYNHQAIFGRGRKEIREVMVGEEASDNVSVRSHTDDNPQVRQVQGDVMKQRVSRLEEDLGSLKTSVDSVLRKMDALLRERSSSRSPQRSRGMRSPLRSNSSLSRSPSPNNRCFHCSGLGHFKSNCPSLNVKNKQSKSVSFRDPKEESENGSR